MADKVKLWFDAEADFLEVRFNDAAGYMKQTANNAVLHRMDTEGNIIGFSILGVSRNTKERPLAAELG
jgi:ribosomal protein S11